MIVVTMVWDFHHRDAPTSRLSRARHFPSTASASLSPDSAAWTCSALMSLITITLGHAHGSLTGGILLLGAHLRWEFPNLVVLNPKKPLTRVSKPVPEVHGKRGLERGWQQRLAKGWRKVGEGLAKGWHKVGEALAKGWRVSLHTPMSQIHEAPVQKTRFVTPWKP